MRAVPSAVRLLLCGAVALTAVAVTATQGSAAARSAPGPLRAGLSAAPATAGQPTVLTPTVQLPAGDAVRGALLVFGDRSLPDVTRGLPAAAHHTYARAGRYTASLVVLDARGRLASTTAAVTVTSAAPAPHLPTFTVVGSEPTDTQATTVTIGDVNGDGHPDVVVGNNTLQVYFSDGKGGFTTGPASPLPTAIDSNHAGYEPPGTVLSLADVNGDGKADATVILGYSNGSNAAFSEIVTLLGDGAGHFTVDGAVTVGSGPTVLADLNGDHRPDLVVMEQGRNSADLAIWLNRGDGTFGDKQPVPVPDYLGISGLAIGDVNGDGAPDILISGVPYPAAYPIDYTQDLRVLTNNGRGVFSVGPAQSLPIPFTSDIALVDVNGDRRADLVDLGSLTSDGTDIAAAVLLNNGSGTFAATAAPLALPSLPVPSWLSLQTDSAGHVIAVGSTSPSAPTDLTALPLGFDATGRVTAGTAFALPAAWATAYGDVTGDAIPDIVALTNTHSGAPQVELATGH